ncbi:MAG: hypothetical protein CSB48_11765 [Proteobacteria bacterium]|nr:MAG: hypothetical protein CSB48_11765 [Pseudomonadota bacterium]
MSRLNNTQRLGNGQSGQSLPLILAFVAFGCLMTLILFNTGKLASEKSHVVNTADAAVYSGLVWQARALNYLAYTNRAMVANQVSIGQFVSLKSWTEYGAQTATNIDEVGQFTPFAWLTGGVEGAMVTVNGVTGIVANVAVQFIDGVNRMLSESQEAVYLSSFAITPNLVREVVRENNSNYKVDSAYSVVSLGQNAAAWNSFVTKYKDEDGINRKVDLINRSKDAFTNNRGWKFGSVFIAPNIKVKAIKEGKTALMQDGDDFAWVGKDTLSIHVSIWGCSWKGCGWKTHEIPIGWGGAYASGGMRYPHKYFRSNKRAERLADDDLAYIGGYTKVNPYHDIKELSEEDPRIQLKIEVYTDDSNIRTSTKMTSVGSPGSPVNATKKTGLGPGMFWAEEKTANSQLASMSMGEVYFERPETLMVNGQEKKEYGNLFNPYWQVRLTDIPDTERLAVWMLKEPGLASGSVGVVTGLDKYTQGIQDEIENINGLKNYNAYQQTQLPSLNAEKVQIENRIDSVNGNITSLENELTIAEDMGLGNTDYSKEQLGNLVQLHKDRSGLQSELASVNADIAIIEATSDQADILDSQLLAANSQTGRFGLLSDKADSYRASFEQARDSIGNYANPSVYASQLQNFVGNGQDALQQALSMNLIGGIEQKVKGATDAIVDGFNFADIAGATAKGLAFRFGNFDISGAIQSGKKSITQQIDKTAAHVSGEIQRVINEVEVKIVETEAAMNTAIASTRQSINEKIADLNNRIDNLDPVKNEMLIKELSLQVNRQHTLLISETERIKTSYLNEIDKLKAKKTEVAGWIEPETMKMESEITAAGNEFSGQVHGFRNEF